MVGLVQRYNVVDEYSALLSTKHDSRKVRYAFERQDSGGLAPASATATYRRATSARTTMTAEASEWREAVCPPLEDVQTVIGRMQGDASLTQEALFRKYGPVVAFGTVFVVTVLAIRPQSALNDAMRWGTREECRREGMRFGGVVVGGVVLSLLVLKCALFVFGEVCSYVLSMGRGHGRERAAAPSDGMVLGGFFA